MPSQLSTDSGRHFPFPCTTNRLASGFSARPGLGWQLLALCLISLAGGQALAQPPANPNFSVTVNTGPVAPNADTVYPGQATSLRITLSNNSSTDPITNTNFIQPLPTTATGGLRVNGPASISGDGCTGGTLTAPTGGTGIELAGLTIPVRVDGVPNSGECYLDIPVAAWSSNGSSTSHSYSLPAGSVNADQGPNSTGGPQGITVLGASRPTVSKSFPGSSPLILGGNTGILRIRVNNPNANVGLTNFSFTDVFPTHASGIGGAVFEPTGIPATGSCIDAPVSASAALTAGAAAQVAVSGGTLAPNSECTLDIPIRARHTADAYDVTVTNSIPANGFSSFEGLQPANAATADITVRSPLGLTKSFAHSPIASGVPSTFTLVLANSGSTPLTVSNFDDNPISAPPYTDRLTVQSVNNSCGGDMSVINDDRGIRVGNFSIPAGDNCTITVGFSGLTPGSDLPTSYTNQIPEGAVTIPTAPGAPAIVSPETSATVMVADRLRVLKEASPGSVAPGNPVEYRVIVQNFDSVIVTGVTVADVLQNGATLLTHSSFAPSLTPASCGTLDLNGRVEGDNDLLFTIPQIAARTSVSEPGACTLSFWAMIDPDTEQNTGNLIEIGGVCIEGDPLRCNAAPSNDVSSNHQAIVSLRKTFDHQTSVSRFEGTTVRMRLQVSNYSDNPLTTLSIEDTLPNDGPFQQLRIASPANIQNSCGGDVLGTEGSTSITLNNGSIAARNASTNAPATCELAVDVVGPAGTYPNTAELGAVQTNADLSPLTITGVTASATLTYTDALTAAKSFNPTVTGDGGRAQARIRLGNLSTELPLTGISLTDNLPDGMLVASPANAYTTCHGPTQLTALEGSDTVSLSGANLVPGGVCDLLFDVIVSGDSSWTNTIEPGQLTADGGLVNRDPVSAILNFQAPAVPVISKAINPGTISPGQSSTLTITITNGAEPITNLLITDHFTLDGTPDGAPNGMRVASPVLASTTCPGGTVSAQPGNRQVTLSGVSLAANQACQVSVRITSTVVGTTTNLIPMDTISTDQGATNSTSTAMSTLSTTTSLGVSKEFIPKVISPGETSRLRITIYNTLEQSIVNFGVVDNLPGGMEIAADPRAFSNCGGAFNLTWPSNTSLRLTGGNLGAAQNGVATSCYIEADVVVTDPGSYPNTIPADSITVDDQPVNHPPATDILEVRESLRVNKAIDGLTLDAGDPVGFTTGTATRLPGVPAPLVIRLENTNDTELTQVSLVDQLPEGLVIAPEATAATSCTDGVVSADASAREIRLTGATLAATGNAGSVCEITVDVSSNIAGIYTNTIPAGGVTSYEGVTNETPTEARLIVTEPSEIAKEFEPPVVPPGASTRLTIVINNRNEADMILSAALVDNLPAAPAQMRVATPSNLSTSCPGGVGVIQADADSTSVQLDSGAVIPPGGCRIEVDVTADEPGSYLNHLPVGALQTNFGPNEEPAEAPLLVSTLGYISGKVFIDHQTLPDGQFIPGDSTPIAGNPIELRQGGSCSGTLLRTTTTDALGNYLFAELPAGTYSVCQPVQPPETLNSITTEGVIVPYNGSDGTPGTASNPPSGPTSQILGIVLNDNGNEDEVSGSPQNNFSEVLPASIAGWVYHDRNDDGIRDAGEEGIGQVTVTLTGTTVYGNPITPIVILTQPDGSYRFPDLLPGTYTVTQTQPAGWTDRSDTPGSHGGDNSTNDVLSTIILAAGDDSVNNNFGEGLPDLLNLALSTSCNNNAPYVSYTVDTGAPFGAAAPSVTISWITPDGRLVEEHADQPSSGTLLWPGVVLDGGGNAVAWPGWEYVNDEWVEVADDRRPVMIVRVEVNPTAEGEVTYPSSNIRCAPQPPGTYRPPSQVPTLSVWGLTLLSLLLMFGTWMQQRHRRLAA